MCNSLNIDENLRASFIQYTSGFMYQIIKFLCSGNSIQLIFDIHSWSSMYINIRMAFSRIYDFNSKITPKQMIQANLVLKTNLNILCDLFYKPTGYIYVNEPTGFCFIKWYAVGTLVRIWKAYCWKHAQLPLLYPAHRSDLLLLLAVTHFIQALFWQWFKKIMPPLCTVNTAKIW